MDTSEKLQLFLKCMDYGGKIATNRELKSLCNPKTEFIWEQLIENAQRREKIEHIRNNRLISAISKQTNNHESEVKNVELWKRRKELQKSIAIKKEILLDKEKELQGLSKRLKIREITVGNMKEEYKEKQTKCHMLELKCKQLKEDVEVCKKFIKAVKTPEESDPCKDNTQVLKTLTACVKKLAELQKQEFPLNNLSANVVSFPSPTSTEFIKPLPCSTVRKSAKRSKFLSTDDSCSSKKNEFAVDVKALQQSVACRDLLKTMRHENDRTLLWKNLEILSKTIKTDFLSNISKCEKFTKIEDPTNTYEYKRLMAKLYSIDVSNKLKTLHYRMQRKRNNENPATFNSSHSDSFYSNGTGSTEKNSIVDILEEEIQWLQSITTCDQELNSILRESTEVEEKIANTTNRINCGKLEIIKKIYESMMHKRQRRYPLIASLQRFAEDTNWALPLTLSYASDEVEAFIEFPLNYYTSQSLSSKSQVSTYLPLSTSENIDNYTLHMLVSILRPERTIEYTMLNLWKKKAFLNILKSWQCTLQSAKTPKYTFEELQKNELYIESVTQRIIESANKRPSVTGEQVKALSRMWLEMPFNECILPSRTFNEQTFEYYKSAYEDLYRQISK